MATTNAPEGWLTDYFSEGTTHKEIGIVFVHGFTGAPASMRPWAAYFEERGYTVSVPRLPGHATQWQDLNKVKWQEWPARVQVEIDRLKKICTKVFVFGLSMGGHGALTLALRHERFRSVSALAPICAPTQSPWGEKAFGAYLGPDRQQWPGHDAAALMRAAPVVPYPQGILIDQGLADPYLTEQLRPETFEAACASTGQVLTMRRHAGYDHGYYFIQTFIGDHLAHHARCLNSALE